VAFTTLCLKQEGRNSVLPKFRAGICPFLKEGSPGDRGLQNSKNLQRRGGILITQDNTLK
jgi:hypothetical protein